MDRNFIKNLIQNTSENLHCKIDAVEKKFNNGEINIKNLSKELCRIAGVDIVKKTISNLKQANHATPAQAPAPASAQAPAQAPA